MGLFDEIGETPSNREGQRMGKSRDTLFDWMVRRAEADLGAAQALAAGETQRADQIKRLETTLIGQINKLQHQVIESHDAELSDLKAEIFACADRIAHFEATRSTADAAKQVIQELGDLRAQLIARQTELETRSSGFERLGESLTAHINGLEEELRDKLDGIRTAQGEMRHFQSETQSLAERVAQAESATWQARTLVLRNTQQLEQTTESIKSDILALNSLFTDFNDNQRNLRLLDTLLKELAQNLGAKIEGINDRLAHSHNSQLERDARLGQLDSGLAMLAERITRTESLSHQTHALTQAEVSSASDFRKKTLQELSSLEARLSDSMVHHRALQELELSLRAQTEEWQHEAAQKFTLLDGRDTAQERGVQELASILAAKLTEQDEKLRPLATVHEELFRLGPEVQTLGQRISQAELAVQRAQDRAEARAKRIEQLEDALKSDIAALNAEVAKLADQQRSLRLPEDQLREIERELGVKVDELQRQLAVDREGFDHWGKGLRQSFGAELSAIQARLSERQSQIEHRYARLERWEETVKANFDGLEAQLKEKLQLQTNHHEKWDRFQSRLGALDERTSQLEIQVRQEEDRAAAIARKTEESVADLQREISTLETLFDQQPLPSADSIIRGIEENLGARLHELEERFARQLSEYDSRAADRARQSDQTLTGLQDELAILKTALDDKEGIASAATVPFSTTGEEQLWTKIRELDRQVAERFSEYDRRTADRTRDTNKSFETLQSELASIRTDIEHRTDKPTEPSLRDVEEFIGTKIQEFQQPVAQKLTLLEKCDSERTHQIEQVIAGFKTEMAALNAELIRRPAGMSPADPARRGLEENLSAKIEELRQQMAQKFSECGSRESDLKELKERSQSLIQRVTQLSAAIQSSQDAAFLAVQPMAPRPEVSAPHAPAEKVEGEDNPTETQARSEKEQLIKLQERMSAEIERVRTELKERSGRWKVRKSAAS